MCYWCQECYKRGVIARDRAFKMPLKWTQMLGVCGIKAEYIAGQGEKCGIESIKQEIAAREGWGWRVTHYHLNLCCIWMAQSLYLDRGNWSYLTKVRAAGLFSYEGKGCTVDKSPRREAQFSISFSLFLKFKRKYFSHRNFTTCITNPRCLLSFQVRTKLGNSVFVSVKFNSFVWGFCEKPK